MTFNKFFNLISPSSEAWKQFWAKIHYSRNCKKWWKDRRHTEFHDNIQENAKWGKTKGCDFYKFSEKFIFPSSIAHPVQVIKKMGEKKFGKVDKINTILLLKILSVIFNPNPLRPPPLYPLWKFLLNTLYTFHNGSRRE